MEKNVVLVQFERYGTYTGKSYAYFTDLNLDPSDFVVVKGSDTLKIVKIVKTKNIPEYDSKWAVKWVIQKINPVYVYEAKEKENK